MSNRLGTETSPYLRQHADNPVHWQPWDAAALAQARMHDQPILLSIGYSACHWCHVMAHECFENDAIAAVMNRHFVNIKVDREERPDLDRIYQLAHQALSGRGGGWPLTVFLSADDLLPFFAGTYFPPTPRHGLPAFPAVLEGIARYHRERRDEIRSQNGRLQAFLDDMAHGDEAQRAGHVATADVLSASLWSNGLQQLTQYFDSVHGGHRGGPKFPHSAELRLWLRALPHRPVSAATAAAHPLAERVLRTTLTAMAERGLYDHLGGGFFRYCVDDAWTIPHFEKMLYDNAQLLPVYAEAAQALGEPRWLATIAGTLAFLERELRSEHGAFYCAMDADSPGGEGAYYVWTPAQVQSLLPPESAALVNAHYGLDGPPNFEGHAWHLLIAKTTQTLAAHARIDVTQVQTHIDQARAGLLAERERRPRPGLDDKVLTAWNALTIAGLARTARALHAFSVARADQSAANRQAAAGLADRAQALADAALDRLHARAWRDGRLYADQHARFPAYLDDHAFLLDALLEQLQQRWHARDADWVRALAGNLLARFEDGERGGFYFTAHDHETLPQRPKPWTDDATPSGNALAARALLALGHLFGEPRWLAAAERTLHAAAPSLRNHPQACAAMLLALDEWLDPPAQLVLRAPTSAALAPWREALAAHAAHRIRLLYVPGDPAGLPVALQALSVQTWPVGYLCQAGTCSPALYTLADINAALPAREA